MTLNSQKFFGLVVGFSVVMIIYIMVSPHLKSREELSERKTQIRQAVDRYMAGEYVEMGEFPWMNYDGMVIAPNLKSAVYDGVITQEESDIFRKSAGNVFLKRRMEEVITDGQ